MGNNREIKDISEYRDEIPASVWAAMERLIETNIETDRRMEEYRQETDRRMEESNRRMEGMEEDSRETKKRLEEITGQASRNLDRYIAENERRMKKFDHTIGAWSNNHGSFAEEYFFNSFENGKKNFSGEEFYEIAKQVKGLKMGFKDEYDVVIVNGTTICIIEVKFKGHIDHIERLLNKAITYRENFPYHATHKIYMGFATLVFTPELEQECEKHGIAIIKQVGDAVVINDAHLRAF